MKNSAALLALALLIFFFSGCIQKNDAILQNPSERDQNKLSLSGCLSGLLMSDEKGQCLGKLAVQDKNILICLGDGIDTLAPFICKDYYALQTKDLHSCGALVEQGFNGIPECYGKFALESNDFTICDKADEKYPDQLIGLNCYYYLAGHVKDLSACSKLKGDEDKSHWANCASEVAISKMDPSICGAIDSNFDRDLCYVKLQSGLRSADLCKKIEDENLRKDCVDSLNNS